MAASTVKGIIRFAGYASRKRVAGVSVGITTAGGVSVGVVQGRSNAPRVPDVDKIVALTAA